MDLLIFNFFYSINKDATETEPSMRTGPQSSAVQMPVKDEETSWNVLKLFRDHSKLGCLVKVKEPNTTPQSPMIVLFQLPQSCQ